MSRTNASSIHPFHPDDFWLFIDAASIRKDHRTRRDVPETDHDSLSPHRCTGCRRQAFWALVAYAGRAQKQGWTRDQGLADLEAHPATYDSMAKEGHRRENAANGKLASPSKSAFGARYETALRRATDAGLLSVSVRAAQELLGFVIQAVQDPEAPDPRGDLVNWAAIADRLADGPYHLPAGVTVGRVWGEIEAACRDHPPAHKQLHAHVYSQSANGSRNTIGGSDDDGDSQPPLIEQVPEDEGLGGSTDVEGADLVVAVAHALTVQATDDVATAEALTRRIVVDRLGAEAVVALDGATIRSIADDAIHVARRGFAVRDAAEVLVANDLADADDARVVVAWRFAELGVTHPYDLDDADGRSAHHAWLTVAARDALHAAQERRLAAS